MKIKQIEFNNFRIYYGKNTIDLTTTKGRNLVIVSGKNGFGKTTFLMGLVWCLYGRQMEDVDDLYKKEISDAGGYQKYITNSINRLSKKEQGRNQRFSVSITFSHVNIQGINANEIEIIRSNDSETNNDELVILVDGKENELAKMVGAEMFIRDYILPKEIAKFFFFDAEKIVSLAEINTAEQRRKLSSAYSEVLGIKKYEDMKNELEEFRASLRKESASVEERQKLNALQTEIENIDLAIQGVIEDCDGYEIEKRDKKRKSEEYLTKLIRAGSVITEDELLELRNQEEKLELRLVSIQEELKQSYDEVPFAIVGNKLIDIKNQIALEQKIEKAKFQNEDVEQKVNNVINELVLEEKSFDLPVDHRISTFFHHKIQEIIKKHFFSDIESVPVGSVQLHTMTDNQVSEFNSLIDHLKYSFGSQFKAINEEYQRVNSELSSIRRKIKDAESKTEDPIVAEDRQERNRIELEIQSLDLKIQDAVATKGAKEQEKVQKSKQINELQERIQVSKQNKEKDDTTSQLIKTLTEFIKTFKQEKKKSLEDEILKSLKSLMHKKNFIKRVEVQFIGDDMEINLFNSRDEQIRKEALSKGEQQMYATSLLMGLVEESDIDFPVFIDSPMQKFDDDHAENIVRYFYPRVSEQVVIFPLINKEMTQDEYNIILPRINQAYLINNRDEDSSEFLQVEPENLFRRYKKLYKNAD
ncbi:MAG: DNA sulfur modification protein DndD [Bacteroidia bacterium]|jgi:DNA sulfur modification protein DndD|nr:DNA sulfur modification protein DndD [Bacteroidia bacterium]